MPRSITPVRERKLTRTEAARRANAARLLTTDWREMTRAANQSGNHVKSLERWITKAREAHPDLTSEQAITLAQTLRSEHFRQLGRLSARSKKLAREAAIQTHGMV